MKKLVGFLILILGQASFAVPIVNENVANSGMITIYPDHQDPHRFYIAPNVVTISENQEGIPRFSYNEYNTLFKTVGVLQMTLVPAYTRDDLEGAKALILKKDPQAQFSGLPFIQSSLQLTGELPQLIANNQCNHAGGLIGQEQACAIVLTSTGRKIFNVSLERKMLFLTLNFLYDVQAVIKKADGSFADQVIRHGIAARIDGGQLAKYPQLFHRIDD